MPIGSLVLGCDILKELFIKAYRIFPGTGSQAIGGHVIGMGIEQNHAAMRCDPVNLASPDINRRFAQ